MVGFKDEIWLSMVGQIAIEVVGQKFMKCTHLQKCLAFTKDSIIVETTADDPLWANGLEPLHPDCDDPRRWQGVNILGFALMMSRWQFQNDFEIVTSFELIEHMKMHRAGLMAGKLKEQEKKHQACKVK